MRRLPRLVSAAAIAALVVAGLGVPGVASAASFDPDRHSIDDASSFWVVVNKQRPLSDLDYAPKVVKVPVKYVYTPYLRPKVSKAVVKMFAAFKKQTGLEMQSQSAYRSYSTQVSTYNGWVDRLGQEGADLTSARPGHSEHQTGLAIDVSAVGGSCALQSCFAQTKQGKWLKKKAWKYGFVLRYPKGQTDVTGYEFEPWHYRFVGKGLAAEYRASGAATLEGFWGLPAARTY